MEIQHEKFILPQNLPQIFMLVEQKWNKILNETLVIIIMSKVNLDNNKRIRRGFFIIMITWYKLFEIEGQGIVWV